jgi:hypothetical protein
MQQKLDTRWTWAAPEQRRHEERVTSAILEKMGRGNEMGAVMQAMARSRQNVGGHHFSSTSKSKRRTRKSRARKRSKSRKSRARKRSKSRKSRARKRSTSRKSRGRVQRKSRARKRSTSRKSRGRVQRKSRKSRVKKLPKKLLKRRTNNVITNYKKLWKPMPKPLTQMSREELIKELRSFRNAWERITSKNMDLSNSRLRSESLTSLRSLLKHFYTNESKLQAEQLLRK